MKKLVVIGLVIVAGFAFVSRAVSVADLIFAGSSTVQKRIMEPCAVAIQTATGHKITVLGLHTEKGFQELVAGKVSAAIASSPLSMVLKKAGLAEDGVYQEHVITKDVIVPFVHPENPVTKLTWAQLSDIYTGKITNWKDVGGADSKIIVVTSQPGTATREFFQQAVMKSAPFVTGLMQVQSPREEIDLVAKFKGGIGAVSEGFVAMNPGKVRVVTTDPISRPLSIITKGNPSPEVKSVIDYLKTPAAQKLFK